jgi:Chondroitin N-acetylgalactosaminyltransferase.
MELSRNLMKVCSPIAGLEPGLNKFIPQAEDEVLTWEFISRSLYSAGNANPRRRIESPLREGLDDVVREVFNLSIFFKRNKLSWDNII